MKYKASKDFQVNGIYYEKGDEVDIKSLEQLVRLNEKGFIGPLTPKEIQNFGKEPKKKIIE